MKRLIVTDTHLGLYSDSDIWLDIVLDFFTYISNYCYENKIKEIIHLGDFFDNRKSLNTKTQHVAHKIADVLDRNQNLHTYIIVGNHDCYYKNQIIPNTLELFNEYDHITVVDDLTQLDDIILAPWGTMPLDAPEDAKHKYLFGHFEIKGFHMNDSYKCKKGRDKANFKHFKKVLSGHFHTPSSKANITYLGAPYGQTFHDAGGIRGFHIFDDGKLDFIEYENAPKFVKVYTESSQIDENEIRGNIVRIIFTKDFGTTGNQEIIDNIIKYEPILYSINYSNIDSEDEVSDESSIMETKDQIVDQYIDSHEYPANINVVTLKSMFKKLMKEAGQGESKIRSADGTRIECESIGFQNFLSFGSKWQDVNLYNGVNFVTGIDKDKNKSNGAGKSSFLETIPFALFGKTARDINKSQIINWKNKKKCSVVFRFKINNVMYEIKRGLKPDVLEIYKDGELIEQDAHKSDYQAMFEEIFGMDVKTFNSLIHSNVNNSANIMNMKKADKRVFLERMFGLEIYSLMNSLSNEKLRNAETKKYTMDKDIESLNDKIESCTKMRIKFNLEINEKEQSLEDVDEIKEELEKLKEDNPTVDSDIDDIKSEMTEKIENFNKITLSFEKWKAKLDAEVDYLKESIKNVEDNEEQLKKNEEIQLKIKAIVEKVGDIDDIEKKINEKKSKDDELSKLIDENRGFYSEVDKDITKLENDFKHVEDNLRLLSEGKCPVCGQDVKDPKMHYENEQHDLNDKIVEAKRNLEMLKVLGGDYEKAKKELTEKIDILSTTKERIYKLKSQIKNVDIKEGKDDLIKKKNETIKNIEDTFEKYKKKKDNYTSEIKSLENKVTDLTSEKNKIKNKEKEYSLAEAKAEEVQKHIKSLEAMIEDQNNEIEKIKKDIDDHSKGKKQLNDIVDYLNQIKEILKDENIKQFSIKLIMPFVNKQVNYYLSEVNYGFYVKIDKWLDVEIKGPGIRNASYDNLSGGERRGIDIALQLALIDVARTQSGIFPDLLVFDELLDSSIDSGGINELMKIVKVKQKEFNGKVFIITHRNEVDNELIDNEYKVVKENGYSRVIH